MLDMLKKLMEAFWKADPAAAASFRKEHQGFGGKIAKSKKEAKAAKAAELTGASGTPGSETARPITEEWKPVKSKT